MHYQEGEAANTFQVELDDYHSVGLELLKTVQKSSNIQAGHRMIPWWNFWPDIIV